MRVDLASELQVLAEMLTRIAHRDRRSRDFTTTGLRRALTDTIAAFPVYRTYVVSEAIEAEDHEVIDLAIAAAQARRELPDGGVYDFLRDALSVRLSSDPARHYERVELLRFVLRFQQYTGPVSAKSLEDTAFYRYVRLVALNEVGGEPARFGRSVAEFHAANGERAAHHPHAMLATATHDHKRGEDTRLRIAALTEFPAEWSRALARWARLNAAAREVVIGAPTPVDEVLFYQTVVGTLPADWLAAASPPADAHASYVDRLVAYARKAAREAKLRTNWTDPNEGYERGLESFVRTALATDGAFLPDALAFTRALAPVAAVHGLAQVALKLTAPGVPDVYQGCEWWDFSLVDPDNRRPVDYEARAAMLAAFSAAPDTERLVGELLAHWTDGGIKLFVTWRLLRLRRDAPHWFVSSAYAPLVVERAPPESTIAFRREGMVVVVPRLVRCRLDGMRVRFPDAALDLGAPGRRYRHALDGRLISADGLGRIALDAAFANLPVAVLLPED
jgi:(1->4)-alpha-D-glucan 1-alpha-D-glucosylmutase